MSSGQLNEEPPNDSSPVAPPPVSRAALILPVVAAITVVLLIFLFVGHNAAAEVLTKAILIATVAGKFAVLLNESDGFLSTPYHMALMITYMDLTIGVICVYNVGVLFKIPKFGKKLEELRSFCKLMLRKNKWMQNASFFGTVAFVMFPLSGTGAIGGALFSQMLGMSRRRALAAILMGALLGSFGLALLFDTILPPEIKDSMIVKVGGLVFILLVVAWLTRVYKRMDPGALTSEGEEAGSLNRAE